MFGGKKKSVNPVIIPPVHNDIVEKKIEDNATTEKTVNIPTDIVTSDKTITEQIPSDEMLPENEEEAPLEIEEPETNETFTALPEKSKLKYEKQCDLFLEWCKTNNLTNYTEPVLMQYFTEKSKVFKSSTLWSMFSMLRATMNIKLNINIGNYKKLTSFLKKNAIGYKSEKSKVFTREDINRFLTEAPDETHLFMKVVKSSYSFSIKLVTN